MLTYGSVCSGIEAATVAWHGLGWCPAFFSEIEPFPRAVLAHRWPGVPVHGDFTTIQPGDYAAIDLLVGGTPCQSFSVAGLRGGLDDDRGNLALEYLRLADRLRARWLVWENVPGVLSSNGGRDFGAIIGGLVELGYGFAYRVLDAQHFGVPQRRRRVFVVGYLGNWRPAAAVLFERHSLSGHPAPSGDPRAHIAGALAGVSPGGGWRVGADEAAAGQLVSLTPGDRGLSIDQAAGGMAIPVSCIDGQNAADVGDICGTLQAGGLERQNRGFMVAFHGSQDPDVSGDVTHPLGQNYGLEACIAFDTTQVTSAANRSNPKPGDACHPLAAGAHAPAVTIPILEPGRRSGRSTDDTRIGMGVGADGDPMFTLPAERPHGIATGAAVRRLTPRECERLQGFPDDYTLIPWRGGMAPDGPRYKALGNSMAVPVMAWIGRRIEAVEQLLTAAGRAA